MSVVCEQSPLVLTAGSSPAASEPAPRAVEFRYQQSDNFAPLLRQLNLSLLVTTYQANKLLVVRAARDGGLSTLVRTFERPMGLAVDGRRMALGTHDQIWFLRNAPDIAPRVEPAGVHDACYLPRSSHVTGDIGVHEMAWGSDVAADLESAGAGGPAGRLQINRHIGDELWVVNTRFSCLCTLVPDYSFVPRWRPPFITALAAEDRCHLNGLSMAPGPSPKNQSDVKPPHSKDAIVPHYDTPGPDVSFSHRDTTMR